MRTKDNNQAVQEKNCHKRRRQWIGLGLGVMLCLMMAACQSKNPSPGGIGSLEMEITKAPTPAKEGDSSIGTLGQPTATPGGTGNELPSRPPQPTDALPPTAAPTNTPVPTEAPQPTQGGNQLPEGTSRLYSEELDLSFAVYEGTETLWEEGTGLYVYATDFKGVPYVLLRRRNRMTMSAEDFLKDYVIGWIKEDYGERMVSFQEEVYTTPIGQGELEVPFVECIYHNAYGVPIYLMWGICDIDHDFVEFIVRVVVDNGEEEATVNTLEMILTTLTLGRAEGTTVPTAAPTKTPTKAPTPTVAPTKTPTKTPTVAPTKTPSVSTLATEQYDCKEFSMKIPKGWKVYAYPYDAGGGLMRIIIFVEDPKNPNNHMTYLMALEPFYASENDKNLWAYYSNTYSAKNAPVLTRGTTGEIMEHWDTIYTIIQKEFPVQGVRDHFKKYRLKTIVEEVIAEGATAENQTTAAQMEVTFEGDSTVYDMAYYSTFVYTVPIYGFAGYYISADNKIVCLEESLGAENLAVLAECMGSLTIKNLLD